MAPPSPAPESRKRVYEDWPGNEVTLRGVQAFLCSGRVVTGPGWKASIGTAVLIAGPSGGWLGCRMTFGRLLNSVAGYIHLCCRS